jgi:hypothetical protein
MRYYTVYNFVQLEKDEVVAMPVRSVRNMREVKLFLDTESWNAVSFL